MKVFYAGTEHNSNIILERAAPDSIKDNQVEENKKVTSLCILTSLYNVQALLAGTDDGNIIIYSTKVENKSYDTLSSHLGEVTLKKSQNKKKLGNKNCSSPKRPFRVFRGR